MNTVKLETRRIGELLPAALAENMDWYSKKLFISIISCDTLGKVSRALQKALSAVHACSKMKGKYKDASVSVY